MNVEAVVLNGIGHKLTSIRNVKQPQLWKRRGGWWGGGGAGEWGNEKS